MGRKLHFGIKLNLIQSTLCIERHNLSVVKIKQAQCFRNINTFFLKSYLAIFLLALRCTILDLNVKPFGIVLWLVKVTQVVKIAEEFKVGVHHDLLPLTPLACLFNIYKPIGFATFAPLFKFFNFIFFLSLHKTMEVAFVIVVAGVSMGLPIILHFKEIRTQNEKPTTQNLINPKQKFKS